MKGTRLVILRRLVQLGATVGLVVILWNTRFPLNGFINPAFFFYLDPLVMILAAVAERVLLPGLAVTAGMLALGALLGRAFCGWLCPLGAVLDLAGTLRGGFLRLRRRHHREAGPGRTRYAKYFILAALTAAALGGLQLAWTLDPLTIFVRAFSFTVHPVVNGGIDRGMASLITASGYAAPLESLYRALQGPVLALTMPAFPHTAAITGLFAAILLLTLVRRRLWCRLLCPLGATLALPARVALLQRRTDCAVNCGTCRHVCRMNAIRKDNSYAPEECILCMDCLAGCPHGTAVFSFHRPPKKTAAAAGAADSLLRITRHEFISAATVSAVLIALPDRTAHAQYPGGGDDPSPAPANESAARTPLVRPPGALPEDAFIRRCIRCGNCMKVCPTTVLQPAGTDYGLGGLWTPRLEPAIGYCEYNCSLCSQVCPTEAITPITVARKKTWIMGLAVIDRKLCLPWAKGTPCIVCEEHCPVGDKAIKLDDVTVKGVRLRRPRIDESLCIGCCICVNKCPVRPRRAILVEPPKRGGIRVS